MARVEKTVFISYRRADISWALAVYQYLTSQNYDVFFDYTHIPSGDFEQVIISNIKARAHFILILTPITLDRTGIEGDWLRREIETAIDEKRNIVPLFFNGFSFGSSNVKEKLTGRMANISRYNGLDIPSGYFPEAMERLSTRYLNTPLDAVIHPVSTEVRKRSEEEKVAANKALREKKEDIQDLVKPAREESEKTKRFPDKESDRVRDRRVGPKLNLRPYFIGVGILLLVVLGYSGIRSLINNADVKETPQPTQKKEVVVESTATSTKPVPANTMTITPSSIPSTPVLTLEVGSTTTGKDGMTLLYVPAGKFFMGSNTFSEDERPVHTVDLSSFWIDQTEVTNAMYAKCVDDGKCNPPSSTRSYKQLSYYNNLEFENFPVIYVSWYDAKAYCSWVNRRLPSEAEWEKAARGTEGNLYPWGNNAPNDSLLNYNSTAGDMAEVGKYPDGRSIYGSFDMAGNAWEWVNDFYEETYYTRSPISNPLGPDSGDYRVLRGGAWNGDVSHIRSTYRLSNDPLSTFYSYGFRCAIDASE